jgi:hypothetical protein
VKAKIDNVKPRFEMRRTEGPGQDPHWQDVKSPTSWKHLRPVPYKRDPHDKSPPRTTRLRHARQVSATHDLPIAPTGAWAMTRSVSPGRERHHRNAWGTIPRAMQEHQLAVMQAAGLDKSLNAGQYGCVAIPSTSSPTIPHASSVRGTQAPSTTRSSLSLGPSAAG